MPDFLHSGIGIGVHLKQELDHIFIGAAVERPFQRANRRRNGGIDIRQGRSRDTRCEG